MKGGGGEMSEISGTRETFGQPGMLIRNRDGDPIHIEYTDSAVEMNTVTGNRQASRENWTPRVKRQQVEIGTLVEIPAVGNKPPRYLETTIPTKGQDVPDSIFTQDIDKVKFEAQKKSGVPVLKPNNLDQIR